MAQVNDEVQIKNMVLLIYIETYAEHKSFHGVNFSWIDGVLRQYNAFKILYNNNKYICVVDFYFLLLMALCLMLQCITTLCGVNMCYCPLHFVDLPVIQALYYLLNLHQT